MRTMDDLEKYYNSKGSYCRLHLYKSEFILTTEYFNIKSYLKQATKQYMLY